MFRRQGQLASVRYIHLERLDPATQNREMLAHWIAKFNNRHMGLTMVDPYDLPYRTEESWAIEKRFVAWLAPQVLARTLAEEQSLLRYKPSQPSIKQQAELRTALIWSENSWHFVNVRERYELRMHQHVTNLPFDPTLAQAREQRWLLEDSVDVAHQAFLPTRTTPHAY